MLVPEPNSRSEHNVWHPHAPLPQTSSSNMLAGLRRAQQRTKEKQIALSGQPLTVDRWPYCTPRARIAKP